MVCWSMFNNRHWWFVVFANFCGVHLLTMADFQPLSRCPPAHKIPENVIVRSHDLLWAGSTPLWISLLVHYSERGRTYMVRGRDAHSFSWLLAWLLGKVSVDTRQLWKIGSEICGQTLRIGMLPVYQDVWQLSQGLLPESHHSLKLAEGRTMALRNWIPIRIVPSRETESFPMCQMEGSLGVRWGSVGWSVAFSLLLINWNQLLILDWHLFPTGMHSSLVAISEG